MHSTDKLGLAITDGISPQLAHFNSVISGVVNFSMVIIPRIISLFRAIWSFIWLGDAPLGDYLIRIEACTGNFGQFPKCEQLQATDNGLYCSACGCPPSSLSDVRTKARMIDLKCPLDKW